MPFVYGTHCDNYVSSSLIVNSRRGMSTVAGGVGATNSLGKEQRKRIKSSARLTASEVFYL